MKIDAEVVGALGEVAGRARRLEAAGADGVFTFEDATDPFFPLVLAAAATSLDVYPSCCVGFPRSPTHLAQQSWDLQRLTGGRFKLGVAPQVRAHVERRFSAVWGRPVAHMRELVAATKAVFASWQDGVRLAHDGTYYRLSLMTPAFNPGPLPCGPPPIWLGALGPRMSALAGEVAEGQVVHGFHTVEHLTEVVVPAVTDGLHRSGRDRDGFDVVVNVVVGAGLDPDERDLARAAVRQLLAFYGSTPAYRVALESIGRGPLQEELNALVRAGRWRDLAAAVPDDVINSIALLGSPDEVADGLRSRYAGIADRVAVYTPAGAPDRAVEIIEAYRRQA